MSRFELGKIKATTTTNLETKLTNRIQQILTNRIRKVNEEIRPEAQKVLEDFLKAHRVYKGLDGVFNGYGEGYDLQAEFGLTEDDAHRALTRMMEILLDTVHVIPVANVAGNNRSASVEIQVVALDEDEYEDALKNGTEFSYVSEMHIEDEEAFRENRKRKRRGVRIEWMKWLLEASTDILDEVPGLKDHGILYNLNNKLEMYSRSGRAIMVDEDSSHAGGVNFPYVMPKVSIPNAGAKNFIDEIRKSKEFRASMKALIKKKLLEILKPRQR